MRSFKTERKIYNYNGLDIKLFSDRNNWYSWQTEIYNLIFEKNGSIQEPHPRHITSLIDIVGNSGKSSFFKWILYNYVNEVGRVGYRLSSQFRSNLIHIGAKKLYIIDLGISQLKKNEEKDLLAAIEELKTGVVLNTIVGSAKLLLIEPPHIIISSNFRLNYKFLRKDKWQIYELKKNKTLGKVNHLFEKSEVEPIIKT